MAKLVINLPRPIPASHDCLPHAAMSLGLESVGGMRPARPLVHRLILEEQSGNWVLYRMDERGGFIGDTWHGSREDALWQIKKEFNVEVKESEER